MMYIALLIFVAYLLTLELIFSYKIKKCELYNHGFKDGTIDRMIQVEKQAEIATRKLCEEFSAQFTSDVSDAGRAEWFSVKVGTSPIMMKEKRFYGEAYSISFFIEPNKDGYATIESIGKINGNT